MKSKKGTIFLLLSLFGVLVALGIFFAASLSNQEIITYKGQQQLDLLSKYTDAEEDLFYIDQAAKYAVSQALKDISEGGGFYEESPCGKISNLNVWGEGCYPDYNENFEKHIDKNLNPYLLNLPYGTAGAPVNNYDYFILEKSISAIAKQSLSYYSPFPARIEYSIKPSFTVEIEHNLNDYFTLIGNAMALIQVCGAEEDLEKCIQEKQISSWSLQGICQNRICPFQAKIVTRTYSLALKFPNPVSIA